MILRGNEQDSHGQPPAGVPSGHVDEWAELAVDYMDGRLAPETKAAVERHLHGCPDCADRLQTQQRVVTFLQETYLDDPPVDLEDRVLGELLFPSQAIYKPPVEEPSRWSLTWRRKIRPWLPATVAVAALLIAVVGYGLVKSGSDLSSKNAESVTTVAAADQAARETSAREETPGATTTAAAATTTAAPMVTAAGAGAEATTTTAAASTTLAYASSMPPATQDRKEMIKNLRDAQTPAYLAFEAEAAKASEDGQSAEPTTTTTTVTGEIVVGDGTGAVSSEQAQDVVSQIAALTGMEPLDAELSLGGPTFAAFVSRDDMTQLVDLLRSIGTSVGLTVSLDLAPPAAFAEVVARLLERKRELPVLSADRALQPSVVGYAFTTSTLAPAPGESDGEGWAPPDEAGTHVLVVFYVRQP